MIATITSRFNIVNIIPYTTLANRNLFVFIHDTSLGESFCIVNVCLQAIDLIDLIFYRKWRVPLPSCRSFSFGGIKGSEKIKTPNSTQSISILQKKKENCFLDNSLDICAETYN
jgi:hypothetical protein